MLTGNALLMTLFSERSIPVLDPMKKGKVPPLPAFDAVNGDASRLSTASAWFIALQMASAESLTADQVLSRQEHTHYP